ncbi:TRAP transporter small permease [Salipiger mucosus]|uniref:TRAP transporter small permease protein n=1 Tax=Salipiger mucosus DSM 16094 TaxID=1123237 RepID=S9Q843_9RHOB|nr:TRAP transporter small permease [Salipiger mucosus]EPX76167.1 TRAP-type transport system, small permease component, predicted N-acetylneuraminate transporter [Salipiger mucosus DSM 16094]
MRRIIDGIEKLTRVGGQFVLAFMVITICYDAIMRYLFTAPTSWSLEVNTFLIVYVAVMTAADVQRTDSHIRISFFSDMMGRGAQRVNRMIIGAFGVVFSGIMAWRGFLMAYQAWEYGERVSSSFGTPMVYPYAMLPLGFGLLAIRFALNILDAITGRDQEDGEDLQNV